MQSESQKEIQAATPPKEMLDQMVQKGKALDPPQVKQDGSMTFDYFIQTMQLITECQIMHTKSKLAELTAERRKALKNNDQDTFKDVVYKAGYFEQIAARTITMYFYQNMNISLEIFQKSNQVHLGNPYSQSKFQSAIEHSRQQLAQTAHRELEKQELLKAQELFEEMKFEMHCKLYSESLE